MRLAVASLSNKGRDARFGGLQLGTKAYLDFANYYN